MAHLVELVHEDFGFLGAPRALVLDICGQANDAVWLKTSCHQLGNQG